MKKISIIIAVYNIEKYISKCLDSVIKDKSRNIEIIIVDDGSTDNSLKICQEYQKKDNRIMIIQQKHKGLNAVRNIGFINSTGEYIWHIDGDDYLEDNYIDKLKKYFGKYDIICFNYNRVNGNTKEKIRDSKKYDSIYDKYILSYVVVWNKVFNRKLFEKNSFPENCTYNDIYVTASLVSKTRKIIFIDEYLYNYVDRKASLSYTRPFNLNDYLACLNYVYDKVSHKYPDAALCYYVNNLAIYNYVKEVQGINKCDFYKLNKILKNKFPKYYKNKYYNKNLFMKIYIRLIYYDMVFLVKIITFLKIRIYNKYSK